MTTSVRLHCKIRINASSRARSYAMRMVLAFIVWLFSFHTWKTLFLRWVRWSPPSPPATEETARESDHLPSQEVQQQESSSELSRFLSSSPQDERGCNTVTIYGNPETPRHTITFGRQKSKILHGTDFRSSYREFLEVVASSKVEFCEQLTLFLVEAFGDALRQSDNDLRKLHICCRIGSAIPFAKCVLSVILENDNIQELNLSFQQVNRFPGTDEAAEFMAKIASPHNLRILKSIQFYHTPMDNEGAWEQLMKPFESFCNVQEDFRFHPLTSEVQRFSLSI